MDLKATIIAGGVLGLCLALPAAATEQHSAVDTAAAVHTSLSSLSGRVSSLEADSLRHSARLEAINEELCALRRADSDEWSGSVTHRSEFKNIGGRQRFEQKIGFELNYFNQLTDELSVNLSLEKPLSGLIGQEENRLGALDEELKLKTAFFRLQLGELEDSAKEDASEE